MIEKKQAEEEHERVCRQRLVEKEVLLASAEREGLSDDEVVAALRADVHDSATEIRNEIEAEALIDERTEEERATERITELEALAIHLPASSRTV